MPRTFVPPASPRTPHTGAVNSGVRRLTRPFRHWWYATPNSRVIVAVLSVVLVLAVLGGTFFEIH